MPVTEWGPVAGLERGVWVATSSPTETLVAGGPGAQRDAASRRAASKAGGARFSGLPPARVLDTRTGLGLSGPFDERRRPDVRRSPGAAACRPTRSR